MVNRCVLLGRIVHSLRLLLLARDPDDSQGIRATGLAPAGRHIDVLRWVRGFGMNEGFYFMTTWEQSWTGRFVMGK